MTSIERKALDSGSTHRRHGATEDARRACGAALRAARIEQGGRIQVEHESGPLVFTRVGVSGFLCAGLVKQ